MGGLTQGSCQRREGNRFDAVDGAGSAPASGVDWCTSRDAIWCTRLRCEASTLGRRPRLPFAPFARVSVFRLMDEWLAKHVGAAARRVGAHRVGAMTLAEVAATACRQGRFKVAAMVAGVAGGRRPYWEWQMGMPSRRGIF